MPGRLVAPGPGRSNTRFTVPLLVAGMQKTVASLAACGMPSVRSPASMPVSVMHRVSVWPKAPAYTWPGQKQPPTPELPGQRVALVTLTLPVVRGFRSTLNAPSKGAAFVPSSGGQSWLVLLVAGLPVVAVVEQAPPTFGPAVQPVPVQSASLVQGVVLLPSPQRRLHGGAAQSTLERHGVVPSAQKPAHGEGAPVPLQGGVPQLHRGQGEASLPVR